MSAAAQHETTYSCASAGLSWYAAHIRSNFGKRVVAADLLLKGMEVYVPIFRGYHRWNDRQKLIETPAFRGYIFVRCISSPPEQLKILTAAGTARIHGYGGVPERVPDREIDAIRIAVNSGMPVSSHTLLHEGATVVVRSGPLKGVYGVLLTVKNTRRLVVSVNLLSQSVAAELRHSRRRTRRADRRLNHWGGADTMYPNLKLHLWRTGLRQNQLAKLLHIDDTVLSKIMNGYREPSAGMRRRIAEMLCQDERWLFEPASDLQAQAPLPKRCEEQ